MPYWRLSSFYFFYFATLGALIPYWGPYLRSVGFSASEIGNLMAIILATKIMAPNIWGWIADHSGRCMGVVRLAALLTVITYSGVFFGASFWWLALVMSLFSFFWNASLPQLEATTMNYLGERSRFYGRVRLWGSIGFIIAVWSLGPALDRMGPATILPVLLVFMTGIWISSLLIPEGACHPAHEHDAKLMGVLRRPEVIALLLACLLMQASHAPYYTFYSIYMADHGYTNTSIGFLWALGVICEVGVFLAMHRLFHFISARLVLLWSLVIAALRWALVASFPEQFPVMVFAQAMHAISFGAYHAAAVNLVHRYFTGRHQHRGQALYSSASFGVGGAMGSFYSGYSWTWLGPSQTYWLAAGVAMAAWFISYALIRRQARRAA
jgi:PPP family 3-phenylpropionic acid transporter